MTKKKQFDIREYERIARTLESVAKNYPKMSTEYKAIELAAKALLFACEYTVAEDFDVFLRECGKKLSPTQKEHLKNMGVLEIDKTGKMQSTLKFRKK